MTGWPGTPVTVTVTFRPLTHAISQSRPGHPVAGLEEQNDLLDRWVRLVYHARVRTKKSRHGRGWH